MIQSTPTPGGTRRPPRVELLYFEGCPNHEQLRSRLEAILDEEGIDADVELRCIETEREAEQQRFLGSPTVRINGDDVEPGATSRTDFGLKCRLYRTADGLAGAPSDQWIRAAVRNPSNQASRPSRNAGDT